jgi:hypothetical protein
LTATRERKFGADRSVLDDSWIDGVPREIVGIMPAISIFLIASGRVATHRH